MKNKQPELEDLINSKETFIMQLNGDISQLKDK